MRLYLVLAITAASLMLGALALLALMTEVSCAGEPAETAGAAGDATAAHGGHGHAAVSDSNSEAPQETLMKATEILTTEHALIKQVARALDILATEGETAGRIDAAAAAQAIDFSRGFTDTCHHHKEEQYLFPALEQRGLGGEQGPLAVMLAEHAAGRELIQTMDEARVAAAAGEPEALAAFVAAARSYSALIAAHIDKENLKLFVMADRVLDEAAQHQLSADFARVEAEEMGEGVHERFHEIGAALVQRYGAAEDKAAPSCGHCAGH